eukprot:TRINITY_DN3625_c0_g1_i1.p1 TRINITY_DN3625_c0_g1~~TRINITY_DN3625_c0_g1_i1.p1  ORF type:complete len:421 (+),score=130.16 TRINITY_DN3625_c0_g1_i1:135-1397(+)
MRLENFLGLFGGEGKSADASAKKKTQAALKAAAVAPAPAADDSKAADKAAGEKSPNVGMGSGGGAESKPISASEFDATLKEIGSKVTPWTGEGGFTFVKTMQEAVRNHGRVDLMTMSNGDKVAVKRMPTRWVRNGPREFKEQYPTASERPWYDFGFVYTLNKVGCPYVCNLVGIFRDDANTFVVASLASEGDLFGWCDNDPKPGKERETIMKPIVLQVFDAVRWIHMLGIAHRDISLENILLTEDGNGQMIVKLIDFGMGTLKRWCVKEVRGKQSYQCPEMHSDGEYDALLADAFAVGVSIFAMGVQDYPWISTKRNSCQLFEYVSAFGFTKLLERRKLRKGNGERLVEVLSPEFVKLVTGLVNFDPKERHAFGELCWSVDEAKGVKKRGSVWDAEWLPGANARRFPAVAAKKAAAANGK